MSAPSVTGNLWVGVAHGGEVGGAGARVQLREQGVVPRLGLQPRDAALRVVDVAEDDGLAGAGLLARGLDLPVADGPALVARVDAGPADALDAVRALLHHPAAAHRDLRVAHELEGGSVPVLAE